MIGPPIEAGSLLIGRRKSSCLLIGRQTNLRSPIGPRKRQGLPIGQRTNPSSMIGCRPRGHYLQARCRSSSYSSPRGQRFPGSRICPVLRLHQGRQKGLRRHPNRHHTERRNIVNCRRNFTRRNRLFPTWVRILTY